MNYTSINQPMNQISSAENTVIDQATFTQMLQQLLAEKPSLLTPLACQCHFIDPTKIRILLWKDKDAYILKIAEQKFVGVLRTDRRGEVYWKFRELYESEKSPDKPTETKPTQPIPKKSALEHHWTPLVEEKETNQPLSETPLSSVDRLAKFQARQAQATQTQSEDTS